LTEPDEEKPTEGCPPGDTYCDENIMMGCNSLGLWVAHKDCEHACIDGNCTLCLPGQSKCTGTNVERCDQSGSHWEIVTQCRASCINGACCVPQCGGRECGPNTCGGQCGECGPLELCNGDGQCTCTKPCDGSSGSMWPSSCPISIGCAIDKCGGFCGACNDQSCSQHCTKVGMKSTPEFKCEPTPAGVPTNCALTPNQQMRCVPLCFKSD
jgi:hypothetical protein